MGKHMTNKDKIKYENESLSITDVITIVSTLITGFLLFGGLILLVN